MISKTKKQIVKETTAHLFQSTDLHLNLMREAVKVHATLLPYSPQANVVQIYKELCEALGV